VASKILVVEDHEDSRELLTFQLRHLKYDVIEATNGYEAIERAVRDGPDLIIMDLGLPGMNGIETSAKLKENPKTASIPIIAHTAWDEHEFKKKALEAGIVEYMSKPTDPRTLRRVLEKFLQTRP
jgi:two-component system phosphate regulon response regulator PhoB